MKRLNLRFSIIMMLLLSSNFSKAQITHIATSISDSMRSTCILPANGDFYVSASVMGSSGPSDSITFNVNFGDGTDITFKRGIYMSGSSGYASAYTTHTYTFPGTFTTRVIVTAPGGIKDTAYGYGFTLTNTCGSLNGRLYMDANSNCIKDTAEQVLYWTPIVAVNTTTLDTFNAGWTDPTGAYSLSLIAGSYTIIPNYYYTSPGLAVANPLATPSCPGSGTYSLTVAASTAYTKDFAYTCASLSGFDAKVIVSGGCFFPGDTTMVYFWGGSWAWYYHYVCLSSGLSTTVTVNLDPLLTYIRPSIGLTPSVSGSTLTYTLSSPRDIAYFYSGITVSTATTATIGDTIRIAAYIAPLSSVPDPNLTNNTYNYKKAVASSYDPNIKEVAPSGKGKEGFVATNEQMTYTIHFQNTGTAAAKNITITDKIDPNLDINSMHILGATHNAALYKDGNTIKFRFEHINLPDSGTNYPGSMGSITYAIAQQKDLLPGTMIHNTASIYFDYNAPIITNTTLNTIEKPTSIEKISLGSQTFAIYPNPADDKLKIQAGYMADFTIRVTDMMGRLLLQSSGRGSLLLNTASLSNGTYLLRINDEQGHEISRKIQVLH